MCSQGPISEPSKNGPYETALTAPISKFSAFRHFPLQLGGIFRAERHFLLFKDQLAESRRQKTKENNTPRGKFRLVENDP